MNHSWRALFPHAELKVLDFSTSDHLSILLELRKQIYVQKKHRFRLENVWLKEDDCKHVVKIGWEEAGHMEIMEKIALCGLRLQEWGGGINNEYKRKIKECMERLRKLHSRRDNYGVNKYNEVRWEFLKLLEKQDIYWKQRSKQFWLKEGDCNTRFFHRFASQRRKINRVERIKDKTGQWCETTAEVQREIEGYFLELFTATTRNGQLSNREVVNQVNTEDNVNLMLNITEEEVYHAVFSIQPEKSPGLDGFNPVFYQAFWFVIKKDVIKFCQMFMDTG